MTRNATIRLTLLGVLMLGAAGSVQAQFDVGDAPGLEELRNARDVLIDATDLAAALGPAERVVAAATDADDPLLGQDLLRLADIRAGLGESDAAEETYLQAIESVSNNEGTSAPTLVDAYQRLGRNYLNDRRFDEALVALGSARDISRRNEGLFNTDQATILDDMTLAHLGTGNTIDARELQLERLAMAIRRFGDDDPRLIPFHTHLGDYLDNSRLRVSAREQYERALTLSKDGFGETSTESITLLRRLAEIDLLLDRDSGVPAELAAALATADGLDPLERARSLLVLGDHALVYEGLAAAELRYAEGFELLDASAGIDANAVLASPQPLNLVPPLSRVDRATRRDPWTWGDLVIEFDVAADGRASNVSVVEMTPEIDEIANDYVRRIREAYFRPRLRDGRPVGTAATRYQHNFRYYVRED